MSDPWHQFDEWEKFEPQVMATDQLLDVDVGASEVWLWPGQDSSNDPRSSVSESEGGQDQEDSMLFSQEVPTAEVNSPTASPETLTLLWGTRREVGSTDLAAESASLSHITSMSDAGGDKEEDLVMSSFALIDDPFEEFDVESGSEKDFLITNLKRDAPKDEVVILEQARTSPIPRPTYSVHEWDTTMTGQEFEETVQTARVSDKECGGRDWQEFIFLLNAEPIEIDARIYKLILGEQDENGVVPLPSLEFPAPHLVLQQKVEEFAQSHMFNVNKHVKPTTLQRREYTRDIYDYARAIGLGKHQANFEVLRARAAYRRDRGLGKGLKLDETDDESTLGIEIDDAVDYITFITDGMRNGLVDPAGAWASDNQLDSTPAKSVEKTRKRKRHTSQGHTLAERQVKLKRIGHQPPPNQRDHQEQAKLEKLETGFTDEESARFATGASVPNIKHKQKRNMKRKRASLGMLGERLESKSKGQVTTITTTVITKTSPGSVLPCHRDDGGQNHVFEAASIKTISDEEASALDVNSKLTAQHGQGSHEDTGFHDVRRKKKKKRKRSNPMATKSDHFSNPNAQAHVATNTHQQFLASPDNKEGRKLQPLLSNKEELFKLNDQTMYFGATNEESERKVSTFHNEKPTTWEGSGSSDDQSYYSLSQPDQMDSSKTAAASSSIPKSQLEPVSGNADMKKRPRRSRGTKRKSISTHVETTLSTPVDKAKEHHS